MRIAIPSSKSPARRSFLSNRGRNPTANPRLMPKQRPGRAHERHYGGSAPKDQQCWGSAISRSRDESLGGIKHRAIREIGTRVGRLLSDRGTGAGRVLSGKRADDHYGGTQGTSPGERDKRHRLRVRSGTGGAV